MAAAGYVSLGVHSLVELSNGHGVFHGMSDGLGRICMDTRCVWLVCGSGTRVCHGFVRMARVCVCVCVKAHARVELAPRTAIPSRQPGAMHLVGSWIRRSRVCVNWTASKAWLPSDVAMVGV